MLPRVKYEFKNLQQSENLQEALAGNASKLKMTI
jgi:hypothetical protein